MQEIAVGRFGRAMTGKTVIEGCTIGLVQHGGGRRGNETVEKNRYVVEAGAEDGAGNGGKLAAAEPAQRFQGIAEMACVEGQRLVDSFGLALEPGSINSGAGPYPIRAAAPEEAGAQGRGDGGVADAHLAQAEEVGAARN